MKFRKQNIYTIKKLFNQNPSYHYYEDHVYSMGHYFKGINLRQFKSFFNVIKDICFAYQYMHRYSSKFEMTEDELKCLAQLKQCAELAYTITENTDKIQEDDRNRTLHNYIIDSFDRWIKPVSVLEKDNKVVKLVSYQKVEYTLDEYKSYYIYGFQQAIGGIMFFGSWMDYIMNTIVENRIDINIDLEMINELKTNIISTIENINKLDKFELKHIGKPVK